MQRVGRNELSRPQEVYIVSTSKVCHAAFVYIVPFTDIDLYCAYSRACIVLDSEKDLLAVYQETASVVQWFTLGLYLGIAGYKLEKISVDYRFNYEYLQQMLSAWLKTGAATWLSLVRALKKIGQSDLANQIANKKGVCMHVCV